jgi:hypothetical protein
VDLRSNLDTAIEKYGSGVLPQVALGSASVILGILFAPAAVLPVAAQAAIAARSSQIQRARVDKAQAQIGVSETSCCVASVSCLRTMSELFVSFSTSPTRATSSVRRRKLGFLTRTDPTFGLKWLT